jgi:ribonuclease BN (tRNA processing enzyme)
MHALTPASNDSMKLHILGCGDAFGSGGRHQSGYLFEASDRLFLLDCGPTTLLAMKRAGFAPRRLDAIILSHLHGDHFAGIPFFFIEYLYQNPPATAVTIAGPPDTRERVMELCKLMYGSGKSPAQNAPFTFQILHPNESASVKGIEVFPFRVPHQTADISLALKVTYEGRRVLFSGDSAWTDEFITHARGMDLFLCECSFFTAQPAMHVDYQKLRANRARLECKKLLLTHLGEEMLARKNELEVPCAEDGMVLTI